jgi:hypothetical protein
VGFWNALSVLAPVAPAMSDAADLRTQRQRDAADFASEQALKQAQLTTQKLAAQLDQQRLTAGNAPSQIPGTKDYYSAAEGSWMRPSLVNGEYKAVKIPGQAPADELKQATKGLKDAFDAMGIQVPPNVLADLGYRIYGGTGAYPATGMGVAKPVTLKGPDGQPIGASFSGGRYYDSEGKEIENPVLWEKPVAARSLPPATQYMQLYTKKLLADRKQGPPLTAEETAQMQASLSTMDEPGIARMQALGKAYAQYHITPITDDSGAAVYVPIAAVLAANKAGAPPRTAAAGTADAADKKNAMLASSAIQQVNRMESILNRDPNLTGPGAGQLTQLQVWLGNQDPDAQAFLMSSLLGSEHGVAVFGGRNIHTIQDLQNTLGSWRTNPAALKSALGVIRETMTPWLTAGGRLPGPRTAGAGPTAPKGTVTLKAGGKTYNIPRDQVAAFRKDHPDASQ